MRKAYPAIRWSLNRAADEFRTTVVRIRKGLKARGVSSDQNNTYATHEIASALYERDDLERRSREAVFQRKIDEAQVARDKMLENKGELIKKSDVTEFLSDLSTVLFQIIRHSKLSEKEKALINQKITNAPDEFEKGVVKTK